MTAQRSKPPYGWPQAVHEPLRTNQRSLTGTRPYRRPADTERRNPVQPSAITNGHAPWKAVLMPASTSTSESSLHNLSLMRKVDDAFHQRDLAGMEATHHRDRVATSSEPPSPFGGKKRTPWQ